MTRDYDKFKRIEANRDVDHVARIKKSMEERYVPTIITANENLEIIDGQNRHEAVKELGKPLYYTVFKGLGIQDVRAINQGSKNWSKINFVHSYAKEGLKQYVDFENFTKKYHELPSSVIEVLLRLSATHDSWGRSKNSQAFDSIQRGLFVIKDLKESCRIADMLLKYKGLGESPTPIYKQKTFAAALVKMAKNPKFDNEEMLHKIKLQPTRFVRCITTEEYLTMMEKLYNYQRKGGRIHFAD